MCRRSRTCLIVVFFLIMPGYAVLLGQDREPVQQEQQSEPKTPPAVEPGQVVRPAETASTPSTARKIFKNFWSDQKAMWTSPLRINRDNAKWWALFGGSTVAFFPVDQHLSNSLPNTVNQISFSKNVSRIGAAYTTLPVAGALYLYGRTKNDAKAREVGVLGAEALLDSAIIMKLMKLASGRERPELEGGNGRFFKGKEGFPSGHAMETWAFASLISHEYAPSKIVPIITYGLATTVSVSRFTARKHYASDIVAGGAIGWFIGKYVFDHHLDPSIHKRYDPNKVSRFMPEIQPMVVPSTRTYGLSLAWN
jgi:membrane-associated phospholipid phosphatase